MTNQEERDLERAQTPRSSGRDDFRRPPSLRNAEGALRTVGFELEFSGLSLDEVSSALRSALGGEPQTLSVAEQQLEVEGLGRFKVELDWSYLKRKAAQAAEADSETDWVDLLSQAAAFLVPTEVVCPPIPITELAVLHPMTKALRQAGAVGTEESLLAAYGVHINPEIPRLDAETLDAYLRAFALLQWWLVEAHEVDLTRKVSPYIDLYSEAYIVQLLSRETPDLDQIFNDYLEHNASRNRSLDMLPLLAELDAERVRGAVDDPKIGARPTFHYRLPNCQIERPDWSLAASWNRWCVVEDLAHRPADLHALGGEFLAAASRPILGVSRSDWVERMETWLKDRGLV
ncbi:hypothetical protein G3480_02955 [Thiorhodococcus mannitoliphagus]|uniref:Amidoligase enzyme n=1 Tax=Thiorhodococcus mannitoliphagus TaxID=329406 RepID=A0A6P1DQS2_9GAMM|nr:amidoligase family protein [Thiorhodococcus mannitoliphagus]NEX19281.1 hypothetical protein [Thiorhodococcus mannitoliphagus]